MEICILGRPKYNYIIILYHITNHKATRSRIGTPIFINISLMTTLKRIKPITSELSLQRTVFFASIVIGRIIIFTDASCNV